MRKPSAGFVHPGGSETAMVDELELVVGVEEETEEAVDEIDENGGVDVVVDLETENA